MGVVGQWHVCSDLRSAPIADLAGNTVAAGVISRFSVQIPNVLAGTSQTPSSLMAGATFGLKVAVEGNLGHVQTSFIGPVAICLANNPGKGTLDGTYDPKAILPSPYHVLALDAGIHGFGVSSIRPESNPSWSSTRSKRASPALPA